MINCLLIDHNETTRALVTQMLQELGLSCTSVTVWPPGKVIPRNRFDVVLIGNPTGEDYRFIPGSAKGPWRHEVFFYYAQHPDIDVISQLIVNGVADVLVMPFDRKLLAFKLAQTGIRLQSSAA
jgi:DNA-binding NtrC family response regulator